MKPEHRFHTLDGIRGIAAIVVMFSHLPEEFVPYLSVTGSFAVDLFFCLSGFVIAYSYWDRLQSGMAFKEFAIRRVIRLYPMFLIGISIGAAMLIRQSLDQSDVLPIQSVITAILLNAAYLPYLGASSSPDSTFLLQVIFPANNPAWSLFFELVINFIFAIWLLRNTRHNPVLLMTLGFAGLAFYDLLTHTSFPGWGVNNFLGGFPRSIFGFYSGVYIFLLFRSSRVKVPNLNPAVFVIIIGCLSLIPTPKSYGNLFWLGIIGIVIPLLVTLGAASTSRHRFVTEVSDYLGWISYPVYCLHVPVFFLYSQLTNHANHGWWSVLGCISMALASAHLAARFIEEPVRTWLTNKFRNHHREMQLRR